MKLFIVSFNPNAHVSIIVQLVIPTIPIKVLILFLRISLRFHLLENFIFLNIPFDVNLLPFTVGIFSLNVSAGDSFNSDLHVKYVTNDIISIETSATITLLSSTTALPFGTSK